MAVLTTRQEEILKFIISRIKEKGYPPSVREIGANVGLSSTSTVHAHLTHLELKGIIRKDPTKPRALEIIDPEYAVNRESTMVDVPMISQIKEGSPITKYTEGYFKLNPGIVGIDNVFLFKVNGDSMKSAAILHDDYVIVREQNIVMDNEISLVMSGAGEGVIKHFNEGDKVLGKVIGVIRLNIH